MRVLNRALLFTFLHRSFSSSTTGTTAKLPKFRCINQIPRVYQSRVVEEAQKALREYLHTTRSFPFVFAEKIADNSPFALAKLIRKVHFSVPNFYGNFQKLLSFEPINEFEFFLESIGIDYDQVPRFLPSRTFFFSEYGDVLAAACALSQFGFPWNRLGKLYAEDASAFRNSPRVLTDRLQSLKERYEVHNLCLVGICLAFPQMLNSDSELGTCIDDLFCDLKRVLAEMDEGMCVEDDVDDWFELCLKVRIFHDLGCQKGKVGELMCENKEVIFRCPNRVLVEKAEFFCRFGSLKDEIGFWLLRNPEILGLDLETPAISVSGFLKHAGLTSSRLQQIRKKYPYVFERNRMANLPEIAKALDLQEWCFDEIRISNCQLLATYAIGSAEEDVDNEFIDALKKKLSAMWGHHAKTKFDFLTGVGFGENMATLKMMRFLHGNGEDLQKRFDYFLQLGIKHSALMKMIRRTPNILCMNPENVKEKIDFLFQEMGSLDYLRDFPIYMCFEFENRVKRRYQFSTWLRDSGLCTKHYSLAYMVNLTEKQFIARVFRIHRAAPKKYLEFFSYKNANR